MVNQSGFSRRTCNKQQYLCGSGLRVVIIDAQSILLIDSDDVVVSGA